MGHLGQGKRFKKQHRENIMKMEIKILEIYGLKFTADNLRDIADVMDNPKLIPPEFEDAGEFIERLGLK
jgi:hypothetical protein